MSTRVLLVEDSDDHADIVTQALQKRGNVEVVRALTTKEALLHAALKHFDVAIVDYKLPDGDGIDLLDSLRKQKPGMPILFLTAFGSEEVAMQAMSRGATDYMVKKLHYQRELPKRIAEVLERSEDIARVAAAVRHSGEVAPIPRARGTNGLNQQVVQRILTSLQTENLLGAAVFDARAKVVASRLPKDVEAEALGQALWGAMAQLRNALRHVPGAGPPRVLLSEFPGGLLAMATVPGPALVALVFDASADRGDAVESAREAAQKVWDASRP